MVAPEPAGPGSKARAFGPRCSLGPPCRRIPGAIPEGRRLGPPGKGEGRRIEVAQLDIAPLGDGRFRVEVSEVEHDRGGAVEAEPQRLLDRACRERRA